MKQRLSIYYQEMQMLIDWPTFEEKKSNQIDRLYSSVDRQISSLRFL